MSNQFACSFLIIIAINKLDIASSFLAETLINFPTPSTSSFKGFFARKLTSSQLYISNLQEEMIYDIENNSIIKQMTKVSICSDGTLCPYMAYYNGQATYIVSKSGKNVKVIVLDTDSEVTGTSHDKTRSISDLDQDNVVVLDGDGGLSGSVHLMKLTISTGVMSTMLSWDTVTDCGFISIKQESGQPLIFVFTHYSTFYIEHTDGSSIRLRHLGRRSQSSFGAKKIGISI